jgi:hypothetical protein
MGKLTKAAILPSLVTKKMVHLLEQTMIGEIE